MKLMQYSDFQKAIFSEVEEGNSNLVINAVAGSGKTTTIVECCKRLNCSPREVKFLAFNKSIVEELNTRIGNYAEVSTMHSFALNVIKSVYNNRARHKYVKVDNARWNKYIADAIFSLSDVLSVDDDKRLVYKFRCNVVKIFNLARLNLVECDDTFGISSIMAAYGITPISDECKVVGKLLAQAYEMPSNLTIDFTDMLTITATTLCKHIPRYKYVFIDECQDLSKAQRTIMLAAANGGKFIAVGDKRQAINGFCGADAKSFDSIAELPNTKVLPLSVNYRCGKKMIELAQKIVPQIMPSANAIDGVVTNVSNIDLSMFRGGEMVLCRQCAPLVGLCLYLIKHGKLATIKGNDLANELKQMIINANCESYDEIQEYTNKELSALSDFIINSYGYSKEEVKNTKPYMLLKDKCECILHLAKNANGNIKQLIDRIFSEEKINNAIKLMTIHKAKGLESDRVIFLSQQLNAKKPAKMQEWQFEQEKNLQYVALTRAKEELVLCSACEVNDDE